MDMGKKEEREEEEDEEGGRGGGEGGTVRAKWICYVTLGRYVFLA